MIRAGRRTAVVAVLLVMLAACGLTSSTGVFRTAALPDGATPLDGAELTVTSKSFTESILLGKITATYLSAAGAEVTDRTGAPSVPARQALLAGDADVLWEYTGTAWLNFHHQTETITDSEELWTRVSELERDEHDLAWMAPAHFNNTYAFAVSRETAERLGVTKMSDIATLPVAERTFCTDDEYFSRADGLQPMLEHYGIPYDSPDGVPAANLTRMDLGVIYPSTAAAAPCNFGEVFATDGRIEKLDLQVLDDDRGFFLPYSGTAIVRGEVLGENPALTDLLGVLSEALDDAALQRLNALVDVDGEEPAEVAYDWLIDEGLVVPD